MLASMLFRFFLTLSAATTALAGFKAGLPRYRYNSQASHIHRRQGGFQNQTFGYVPVTGVLDRGFVDGSLPVRREIRDLEEDQDLWTLYLLGLDYMQASEQDDPMSWYKIMGIHGMPYENWDGVAPTAGYENRGYCTHMSALFLSWHRPYLALYEQILYGVIQFIATQFEEEPERNRYVAAAKRFRIPYWDWAALPSAEGRVYPLSVQSPSVDINGPAGLQTIANPLYSYSFHPFNTTEISTPQVPQFESWNHTLRSPSTGSADAVSRDQRVGELLASFRPTIQTRLYNLFAMYNNYTTFSNSAWIFNLFGFSGTEDYSSYDSIESIHDLIHGVTGDGGHMQMVDVSAFDPLFMLHHTMVDRVWAMWQVLNPDSWIEPQAEIMGSYTLQIGQLVDSTTPLAPFHNINGDLYSSDDARRTETFGYAYAETARKSNITDREYRLAMIRSINSLYGQSPSALPSEPSSTSIASNVTQTSTLSSSVSVSATAGAPQTATTSSLPSINATATVTTSSGPSSLPSSTQRVPTAASSSPRIPGTAPKKSTPRPRPGSVNRRDNTHREFLATIKVPKQALNKPFFIHLFLGGVPTTQPREWSLAPNLAGSHAVFSSVTGHRIAGASNGGSVTSTIPLTACLANRVGTTGLASYNLGSLERYMRQNLKYRIVTADGELIDNARLVKEGLVVEVASAMVQARMRESEFPRWGPVERMFTLDGEL